MSVQNAGTTIREARLHAGLSQEKLSEGVCSVLSLSRIENGSAGVSPSTFQALMAHAGVGCEAFPAFADRRDFDCFYCLKRVRFFLDSWQLTEAYDELEKIEHWNWADNKFYHQEWLLMHCLLQFRSGCGDHNQIFSALSDAIHISRPDFDASDFRSMLLSTNEIELFLLLAQEYLYLNQPDMCLSICTQISVYLNNLELTFVEKDRLEALHALIYAKYLLACSDYPSALTLADEFRHKMAANLDDSLLHELTFLTALGYYYTNQQAEALSLYKTAFISAHSIGSCYATICHHFADTHLDLTLPDDFSMFEEIPLVNFPTKKVTDTILGDGTYDLFSPDALSIGGLIQSLRLEQKLSQTTLCQGLCSKSKLSKIENGTLQPDVILAQTLLQRLGISDLPFTFFANAKEAKLQELQTRLVKVRKNELTLRLDYVRQMETLCTQKDTLYLQFILCEKACYESDTNKKIDALHKALSITLSDFDFRYILNYRLSWIELSILNNLCCTYADCNSVQGILYFYKLTEYYTYITMDNLEKKRLLPVTIGMLVRQLYRQKRFSEIEALTSFFTMLKSSVYFTGNVYSHFCQSLGECGNFVSATKLAYYAYSNFLINDDYHNAICLKNDIQNDFHILLS